VDHVSCREDILAVGILLAGSLAPEGPMLRAAWLPRELVSAIERTPMRALLGLDTFRGVLERSVSTADAFGLLGGRAGSVAAFLGQVVADALHGREAAEASRATAQAARLGLRVARFSADQLPVVLAVDDAECFDGPLLDRFVTGLIEAVHGRVLVVVACDPGDPNAHELLRSGRLGTAADRIHRMEVDPVMKYDHRLALAQELVPEWPPVALERLADRTGTYAQVFEVASCAGADDVRTSDDPAALVDALIGAVQASEALTRGGALVAWLGAAVHEDVYEQCATAIGLGDDREEGVVRAGRFIRRAAWRTSPAPSDAAVAALLSRAERRSLGTVVVGAVRRSIDRVNDPIERIGLLSAVWAICQRDELSVDGLVEGLLVELARLRCIVGDDGAARQIAERLAVAAAQDGRPVPAAIIEMLDRIRSDVVTDLPPGSIVGVESRVMYTAALLRTPGRVAEGVEAIEKIRAELDTFTDSAMVAEWQLELAFRLVRADHPGLASELLAPLVALPDGHESRIAAQLVLSSAGDVGEIFLERTAFMAAYGRFDADTPADVRIAVTDNISYLSHRVGDWRIARRYGKELLRLREGVLGADHPDTLTTRGYVAFWTGEVGDAREALRLFVALLPDLERVLGADHPETLSTRSNVAFWTGEVGDAREALRLFVALLPDRERVLGADHPDTLRTRSNVASWTGEVGDAREALRLFVALLPDRERVLGADHPDTLRTRNNVASWTGRLFVALLPDLERVLGAEHPDTLTTRGNVAFWTGRVRDI